MEDYLKNRFTEFDEDYWAEDISPQTELSKAVPAFNLLEGLLDTRKQIPVGDYGMFRLIEDYGVRMLSYGNSSGGSFFGPYRSFLVNINGNTEFVSMNITTYWKGQNADNVKTCLVVAIDNEKETHHALQLVIDDNLVVKGKQCDFYHHGRITVGNLGSAKIEGLRELVREKCPKLISGKSFFLGSLVNDRLWGLDDPEVSSLIVNLISYALLRDEYRAIVKQSKR